MQGNIKQFENQEFGKLDVLMIDSKPYFPATECAKILGYSNPQQAIRLHCKGVLKSSTPSNGGNQQANYIPESDLYRLIIRSKLPAAARFEAWVCDVVLPSIRQHGAYITPEALERMQTDNAFAAELLHRLSKEHAKVGALMDYVDKLQAKAQYYDAVLQSDRTVPATLIAKDYGMTTIAFNKLLHALGVQYRIGPQWFLYKEHAGKGYTVTKTYYYTYQTKVSTHTEWTMKGRAFLYGLLAWYGILPEAERQIGA